MRSCASVCVLVLFVWCVGAHARPNGHVTPPPGRSWWVSAGPGERKGFLNGFLDCKFPTPSASVKGYGLSVPDLAARISAFYSGHRGSLLSVRELVEKIDGPAEPTPSLPGAEVYTNPHGYYDGLWWKGAASGEQPGYVEGYLVCLGRATDLKGAQKIADAITAWYKRHPSKEDRAIAYVLEDVLKAGK